MKIVNVLLDIDNTLIQFDENEYFEGYIQRLSPFFPQKSVDKLAKALKDAISTISFNNGNFYNSELFYRTFSSELSLPEKKAREVFQSFYKTDFDYLKNITKPTEGVKETLNQLKEEGLRLIIASNPFYPYEAQKKRLMWAGLNPDDFSYITHLDNSRFCKPMADYYKEICLQTGIKPQESLMVGDDEVNDLSAKEAGIWTFLLTNKTNNGELSELWRKGYKGTQWQPDFKGELQSIFNIIHCQKVP